MGTFVPPAGLGGVAPPSPAMGVTIGSIDQLVLDYFIGKVIIGGSQFSDTLGRFFPVVIGGGGITLNASTTNYFLTFHDTSSAANVDIIVGLGSGALFVSPNQSGSIGSPGTFVINDRNSAPYKGFIFYPGTNQIVYADGLGGAVLWFNGGSFFGAMITNASATSGANLRLPHGAAPTSPINGDVWTTTAGMFVRINGVTKTVTLT